MRQARCEALLKQVLPIVLLAGDAIMAIYETGKTDVVYKDDLSPVSSADLASHRVLVRYLERMLPNCPIVSEEDESSQFCRSSEGRFWLVDPLDGTKEFIAKSGEFTVNVALIEDGVALFGVVYAPAINLLYWGGPGLGAFRSLESQTAAIEVSKDVAPKSFRVVASKSHLNAETEFFIDNLGITTLVQAGSSLKFCRVAEGVADIYPRLAPTCEWDTAAAQAVLEGAGGAVLDLHGLPLRYGKPDVLNPPFIAVSSTALIPND